MNDFQTNWSKEELKTYLLIYCANADFVEGEDEIELIKSKNTEISYKSLHKEFSKDNDFQSIQKIQAALKAHSYSEAEIEDLIIDVKNVFTADDNFSIEEKNLFNALKKIVKY